MAQRQLPPVPPPPTTSPAPRPVPPPSARNVGVTYADLVEAVRFTYPGQFDDADPSALADTILEMYPQFRGELDETTRGLELLPAEKGGPARAGDHLEPDPTSGKWRPKFRPTTVAPPTGRAPTGTEQIITGGIRTVGGVVSPIVGTAVGGALAATPAAPVAPAAGIGAGVATGAGFEYLAQKYEQAVGVSEEISPLNVMGQGALNLVPFSAGARKAAGILSGLSKTAAPRVAGALGKAAAARGVGARIAEGAIEGAAGSLTGSSLEIATEQDRLPTAEEMLSAAGIGTVFGAGLGGAMVGGQKALQKRRQVKARVGLNTADRVMDLMDPQVGGQILPPEQRAKAALQVSEILQQAAALDPVGGKASMARLNQILADSTQADLQLRAASFLQAFSEQAPQLSDTARLDAAQQFLAKIKEDGLNAAALDDAVRAIAGIDAVARAEQAAHPTGTMRPERMLPAANTVPALVLDPATGRERVGEVLVDSAPDQPIFAPASGPADALLRGDLSGPPPTLPPTPPRPAPVVAGRLRALPDVPPPPADFSGATLIPVEEQIRLAKAEETVKLASATQPELALQQGTPIQVSGGGPVELSFGLPTRPPTPIPRGISALPAVREGRVAPEIAAVLRTIQQDAALPDFGGAAPLAGLRNEIIAKAQALDPTVDPDELRAEFEYRAGLAQEQQALAAESSPQRLLQHIAKYGGIYERKDGQAGELARLREGASFGKIAGVSGVLATYPRRMTPVRRRVNGQWQIVQEMRGGRGLDDVLTSILDDPDLRSHYPQIRTINDLVDFLDDARIKGDQSTRALTAKDLGIDTNQRWWTQRIRPEYLDAMPAPGTHVGHTIAAIAGEAGRKIPRREIAEQIAAFLEGKAAVPGRLAVAAMKYANLLASTWNGQQFDRNLVSLHGLRTAGVKHAALHFPVSRIADVLSPVDADDLLIKYAPDRLQERAAFEAETAAMEAALPERPARPTPPAEVEAFLGELDDTRLERLYADLQAQGTAGASGRQWVAQALEDRGLRRPEQMGLMEESDVLGEPPMPSRDLLELENAMVGERGAPAAGPLDLIGSETGAVGRVGKARAAAAAARRAELSRLSPAAAPKDLRLDEETFRQLSRTVATAGDTEVAGLIVGTPDGQIHRLITSRNIAEDPTTTFEIAPETIAAVQRRAREQGLEVLGSWHTQPSGSAMPSRADIRGNLADFPLLIIGTRGGEIRDARVWQGGKRTTGKGAVEGSLGVVRHVTAPGRTGTTPKVKSIRAAVRKIPTFRGAMGDGAALEQYLATHADELSTEPFFHKAQAALEAGDKNRAWLELQIGQVAYGNVTRQAAEGLPTERAADIKRQIASLEAGSAQGPVGQLWAIYDGRTVWVEGVGRLVVTPEVPPGLEGAGITAGPGGILRPPTASVPLPDAAARTRMSLEVVNRVLKDVAADDILDDPTKIAGTRLFRQVAEEMMLHPASFKAMKALGVDEAQAAAHFSETVTESARILAALSAWKRAHKQAIRQVEGITGADGAVVDLMVTGRGRRVGRLSELADTQTFSALVSTKNSWEKVLLLQTLTEAGPTKLGQLARATKGAMLSQWSTAMRNVYSATARWGGEALVSSIRGLAKAASGDMRGAQRAFAKTGDLLRYAPVWRPDGWVLPGNAMQREWEQIFNQSGWLFRFAPKERLQILEMLRRQPERAAHFIGAVNFGEELGAAAGSGSKLLDWAASPKVQAALTLFNRAQEFSIRSAMLHVTFNDRVRALGLDPALARALPPEQLRAMVGEDNFTHLFDQAVGEAMDFTFAGGPVRKGFERGGVEGGYNTALIDLINRIPLIREGYPFANFNLSAAPRYLWDHSGVSWIFDPLYAKVAKRGRYFLGQKAKTFRETAIPEANQKIQAAQLEMREALTRRAAVKDEITARRRLAARYQKLPASQLELPGIRDKVTTNLQALNRLEEAAMRAEDAYVVADEHLKDLQAQKAALLTVTEAAAKANAPEDWQELLARNSLGMLVMMPIAMAIRADQRDKGVDWYQVKVSDDFTADLRPFAPFVQYLFFADVLQDLYTNTNWAGVAKDLDAGLYGWEGVGKGALSGHYDGAYTIDDIAKALLGIVATGLLNPLDFPASVYANYEGKHTAKSLGADMMQVALSTSQIAGTTLALVDFVANISERGIPSTDEGVELIANTVGQFLARLTIPFAPLKAAASLIDSEEAKVRIAATGEKSGWGVMTGLAQPFANLPFIGSAMIPETYNQLTGQALETQYPAVRALTGVGLSRWNVVAAEIERTGMPGTSVYIRKVGDPYLDRLIGYHYARLVQQYLPQAIAHEEYQRLDSAALRRDALGKLLPKLKKAAIGFAALDAGADTIKAAQKGTEARRRERRLERLRTLLQEEQLPPDLEDPDEALQEVPDEETP